MRTVLVFLFLCSVASAHFDGLFKDLNEKQKEELKAILHDQDSTRAQIHQSVDEWFTKQDDSVQKSFADAKKRKEEWKKKHAEKHAQRVAQASDEAKKVDVEIVAIWKNEDLTKKQTCEQINAIIEKTTEQVKKELHLETRDCSKPFGHRGHRGHHRGHRHRDDEPTANEKET